MEPPGSRKDQLKTTRGMVGEGVTEREVRGTEESPTK